MSKASLIDLGLLGTAIQARLSPLPRLHQGVKGASQPAPYLISLDYFRLTVSFVAYPNPAFEVEDQGKLYFPGLTHAANICKAHILDKAHPGCYETRRGVRKSHCPPKTKNREEIRQWPYKH